jgi:hypothetical protein
MRGSRPAGRVWTPCGAGWCVRWARFVRAAGSLACSVRSWAKLRAPHSCVNPLWDTGLRANSVRDGSWMRAILGSSHQGFNGVWWLRLASWGLLLPGLGGRRRSAGRAGAAQRGPGRWCPLPGARRQRGGRIRCPHWWGVPATYRTWALIAPRVFPFLARCDRAWPRANLWIADSPVYGGLTPHSVCSVSARWPPPQPVGGRVRASDASPDCAMASPGARPLRPVLPSRLVPAYSLGR